ncbi:MAG: alkaline phosphatase [Candidatus Pseudobacter hemicellulosilyticus]|uniref:Alkaline phosphatase n=1 Tax=Candidatus Pseudobacter hemicellulosilyticus TaxID=3121375 RepID=A0AAJ5WL03_9BACT|nr:MAG: alkaline phosphatase [Pseudobacter sp.]
MQRRSFFRNSSLTLLGTTLLGKGFTAAAEPVQPAGRSARNIIFLVSDGMSTGTLTMTDLYLQRKMGYRSNWLRLYDEQKARRAFMDTASANSLVTDSAAGSSAWGGGVRVPNGSLNVNADGSFNMPILQKFKAAGKAVGCVTTVPIAHATPAGFCVNNNKRGDMDEIAEQYLALRFDVMLGGGSDNFMPETRKDKKNLIQAYRDDNYTVVTSRNGLNAVPADLSQPLLGVFAKDGMPYQVDQASDKELQEKVPTLAEMTQKAISVMSRNKKGFVLQVESGKVDWAAHANDIGALIGEQVAFDEALKLVLDFAEKDGNTLVVITTDHGNANPGLMSSSNTNKKFDSLQGYKQSNDWILNGINRDFTYQQVVERIQYAQGWVPEESEAKALLQHYQQLDESGLYNPKKLPFRYLAEIQQQHTAVGWASMDHSADFVELAMVGPGSESLRHYVKNHELHQFMLQAARVNK